VQGDRGTRRKLLQAGCGVAAHSREELLAVKRINQRARASLRRGEKNLELARGGFEWNCFHKCCEEPPGSAGRSSPWLRS
jgi:hypothetical protein